MRARLPAVDIVFQQKNDLRKMGNSDIRRELDSLLRDVAARFGHFDVSAGDTLAAKIPAP
jgi:hypothetical protein